MGNPEDGDVCWSSLAKRRFSVMQTEMSGSAPPMPQEMFEYSFECLFGVPFFYFWALLLGGISVSPGFISRIFSDEFAC